MNQKNSVIDNLNKAMKVSKSLRISNPFDWSWKIQIIGWHCARLPSTHLGCEQIACSRTWVNWSLLQIPWKGNSVSENRIWVMRFGKLCKGDWRKCTSQILKSKAAGIGTCSFPSGSKVLCASVMSWILCKLGALTHSSSAFVPDWIVFRFSTCACMKVRM